MQAAQQANAAALQATQQANAMAQQQQQQQQTLQTNQQFQQAAANDCCLGAVSAPKMSMAAGAYTSAITVRLKTRSRGAAIYYTTDGWSPSSASTLYSGPIVIDGTTTLQAVAVAPNGYRSGIVTRLYSFPAGKPQATSTSFPADAPGQPLLAAGTVLPIAFTHDVTSKGLQVGDVLPVALAQDVTVGGVVVAHKGAAVSATVTQVDGTGTVGRPATLSFAVHAVTLENGDQVALAGSRSKVGQSRSGAAMSLGVIPGAVLLVRGGEVEIPTGATFTATVAAGNQLQAQNSSSSSTARP